MRKRWMAAVLAVCLALALSAAALRTEYGADTIYAMSEEAVFYVRSLTGTGSLKTAGSGFIVSADGLALTAAHVVKGAAEVQLVLASGEEVKTIEILSRNDDWDIAVLRLPAREGGYPFLKLEEEALVTGERVYAIGYPLKPVKVISDGIVANVRAPINGLQRLLITADLASGMSGGPILCQHGRVVGLNSATVRTMNGISISPTVTQLLQELAAAEKTP
ncbi:MAG: S1 family peptidase [bacterium]